jgi:gamma-glutamyltranspeptidase/glutathione hydrolase
MALLLGALLSLSVLANDYAAVSANGEGVVATVHPLATKAALDVFAKGGNAIDAAVAVAFTLGVVDSHNSGIGGGNFAMVRWADGSIEAFDGREQAPAAAHRDMYIRAGKAMTQLSKTGALAVGIPGSLAVYEAMHQQGGKLPWQELVNAAADLAERGFPLAQVSADRLASTASQLQKFPASAAVLLDADGKPWPAGHGLKQPDLANTYRAIAKQGSEYFYRGDFAKRVAQWMAANGGLITEQDFANYKLKKRTPVVSEYRGYQVYGFPPPSSGGVHVAQILSMLEPFDLSAMSEVERYHVMAEAMRLAFADRAYFLGDPDFVPVPKALLSKEYLRQRNQLIDVERAAERVEHGKPDGGDIDLFGKHTTHFSIADKWGNWVSITTTVNTSFGSKVMVPGTGLVLNNQMDDFSIQPGVPNAFGLVGNEANSVQPFKRPLSSMSPTLVLQGDEPVMALGAAGGPTIITQVVQALVNTIDLAMSPEQALAATRVHHQWRPKLLFTEPGINPTLREGLVAKGHQLHLRAFAGASQMIIKNREGQFLAASEPRVIARNTPAEKPQLTD